MATKPGSAFSSTPHRVTHRISSSPSPRNIPSTSDRRASTTSPAPLQGLAGGRSRCASCGGGRKF